MHGWVGRPIGIGRGAARYKDVVPDFPRARNKRSQREAQAGQARPWSIGGARQVD